MRTFLVPELGPPSAARCTICFLSSGEAPKPGSVYKPGQSRCSPHLSKSTVPILCCLRQMRSGTFPLTNGFPMAVPSQGKAPHLL